MIAALCNTRAQREMYAVCPYTHTHTCVAINAGADSAPRWRKICKGWPACGKFIMAISNVSPHIVIYDVVYWSATSKSQWTKRRVLRSADLNAVT